MSREDHKQGSDSIFASGVGTTSLALDTAAAPSDQRVYVKGVQASGDAAAVVTIESPASTVLWRKRYAGAFELSEKFDPPLEGATAAVVRLAISAGTSNTEGNIQGYTDR